MTKKITMIELFSGIGAPRKAMENLGLQPKTLFISEINNKAEKVYRAIFNDSEVENKNDIRKIKEIEKINCDLLVFGSPCQDFSHAGKGLGGEKGTKTRSSLLWEALRITNIVKPKVVIFENVKNLLIKHSKTLNNYLDKMEEIGYHNSHPVVLNARKYGIPQNRERVFVISFFKDEKQKNKMDSVDWKKEETPMPSLENFLKIDDFKKRKLLEQKIEHRCFTNFNTWTDKKGNINGSYNRAWKINKYCGTLSYCNVIKLTDGVNVSKITADEAFLLMGFSKEDFLKSKKTALSDANLISLAGNSIAIQVLEKIFTKIYGIGTNDKP